MAGPAPGGDSGSFRRIGHSPTDADGPCHRQSAVRRAGRPVRRRPVQRNFSEFPVPADSPPGALGVLPAKSSWHVADGTAAVADSSADPPFADGYGGRRCISGGGIQSVRLCAGQLCHRGPSVHQRVFLRRHGKDVSALSEYQPAGPGGKRRHAVYRPAAGAFGAGSGRSRGLCRTSPAHGRSQRVPASGGPVASRVFPGLRPADPDGVRVQESPMVSQGTAGAAGLCPLVLPGSRSPHGGRVPVRHGHRRLSE